MSIGENIRRIREAKGISQYSLAKILNISQQSVDQWERSLTNPRKSNIAKLAKVLNVSIDELFSDNVDTTIQKEQNNISLCSDIEVKSLTEHEYKLIEKYRELSEAAKIRVEARIDAEYDMMKEVEQEKSKDA